MGLNTSIEARLKAARTGLDDLEINLAKPPEAVEAIHVSLNTIPSLLKENAALKEESDRDGEIIDALVEACGPAGDDVLEMIKKDLESLAKEVECNETSEG